ncbi:C-C chemokine receptor type 1 isoform X1 [Oryzias latipes]|uniref:C-C motif chemokine receptor 8 n=2 Tax=Oryzias latipes TaxID=8090 RepID=A0A3B3HUX7_ORYLA|nr:C-C chemokine receptor type 1 isoform X1 [Oryzias latipes]
MTTPAFSVFRLNIHEEVSPSSGHPTTTFSDDATTEYDYDYFLQFETCYYEKLGARFIPAMYSMFFLLGLLGNSLVIWVVVCGARLRSMTDMCLLNLAIADLLLVCSLPFLAYQARDQWLFGDAMCKIVLGVYHVVFYSGIFFICLMSIDRYLAIVHAVYAMKARTLFFGRIAAAVTWTAGFLASFPELIFIKQQTTTNVSVSLYCFPALSKKTEKTDSSSHFWTIFSIFKMNIMGLFIPLCIMTFCYSRIIWKLLDSHSSRKQPIRLVLLVIAVFFCCWVPYNISSLFKGLELLQIYMGCESSNSIRLALQVTEVIAYSHSCLNPILYVFVGEKFRRQLLRLISKTPCLLCQMIKVYIPQNRIFGSTYSQNTSMEERSTAV